MACEERDLVWAPQHTPRAQRLPQDRQREYGGRESFVARWTSKDALLIEEESSFRDIFPGSEALAFGPEMAHHHTTVPLVGAEQIRVDLALRQIPVL